MVFYNQVQALKQMKVLIFNLQALVINSIWAITLDSNSYKAGLTCSVINYCCGVPISRISDLHPSTDLLTLDHDYHHHHHLALQPFAGFHLLSQVSPSSSNLSCFLPVFYFHFF